MKGLAKVSAAAIALAAGLALAGCGTNNPGTGNSGSPAGSSDVTLTWWHNMNTDPGLSYWQSVANDFMDAHPGVHISIQVYQNEDLRAKLKTVFNSNKAPDMFQQWGGGEMADQVKAGYLMDLSGKVDAEVATIGAGNVSGWMTDGKVYGLPYTIGIEGIYYNKDLFTQAGISGTPKTMAELNDAVAKLKAAGIQAVAVGGKDAWPAGHWYFNFALRECSQKVMTDTVSSLSFTDPCWKKAAQDLADFSATGAFNDGWQTTAAQQGAGSSSGMLANGVAAMELMGIWEAPVVGSLAPDEKVPAFLDFFPFPSVPGGQGDQTAAMSGGDGMSCLKTADPVCVDFLKYIVSDKVQQGYAKTGSSPSNPNAASSLSTPIVAKVAAAAKDTAYTQLWLDTAYGSAVGGAIVDNVVALMAGQLDADGFVKALNAAK